MHEAANAKTQRNGFALLHLCSIALAQTRPDKPFIESIDLSNLLCFAKKNGLEAMAYRGLQEAIRRGTEVDAELASKWELAFYSAVRLGMLQDHERTALISQMNEAGIEFALIKGGAIKSYYPHPEDRQMCDFDFWYSWSRESSRKLRGLMEGNGYSTVADDGWIHDTYSKPPYFTVEPHHALFMIPEWVDHFASVRDKMTPVEGAKSQLELSFSDLYVTNVAHAIKHLVQGGVGLRSLIDIYVLRFLNSPLGDWDYVDKELTQLGIDKIEKLLASVARKMMTNNPKRCPPALNTQETELLSALFQSGCYGSSEERGRLARMYYPTLEGEKAPSRIQYLKKRINPGKPTIEAMFPIVSEKPWLYPLCVVRRLLRGPKKASAVTSEIKGMFAHSSNNFK